VKVDFIPAGPALLASRRIVWPGTGFEMSLVGFQHVFTRCSPVEIAPGVLLQVASVPVIILLKMVAYLDRPFERADDLKDIAQVVPNYLAADDERRWTDEVFAAGVDFDGASAFVLGRDLHGLLDAEEAATVRTFLARARDEADGAGTQRRLVEAGPVRWRQEPETFFKELGAFEVGAFS
jgi:predicted nucleotidyltransferase